MIMVNAPWTFSMLWSGIKPFLDARTLDKVCVREPSFRDRTERMHRRGRKLTAAVNHPCVASDCVVRFCVPCR